MISFRDFYSQVPDHFEVQSNKIRKNVSENTSPSDECITRRQEGGGTLEVRFEDPSNSQIVSFYRVYGFDEADQFNQDVKYFIEAAQQRVD